MPMIENTEAECPVFLVTDYKQAFIRILAINSFHNGTIAIDGLFSEAILHDVDTCKVFAKLNVKIKQVKTNTTYNLYKYFGIVMHTGISFQLRDEGNINNINIYNIKMDLMMHLLNMM